MSNFAAWMDHPMTKNLLSQMQYAQGEAEHESTNTPLNIGMEAIAIQFAYKRGVLVGIDRFFEVLNFLNDFEKNEMENDNTV